jgi:DnaK suppressor protein
MNAAQIRRFKISLEAQHHDLTQRIQRLREGLAAGEKGDTLDKVRSLNERESAARTLAFEMRLLDDVREALREIQVGTFGRCASCDSEIPLVRLKAVPWSPFCIHCQEGAEARRTAPSTRSEEYYVPAG